MVKADPAPPAEAVGATTCCSGVAAVGIVMSG